MPGQDTFGFASPFGDSFQLKAENERLKGENAFLKKQLEITPRLVVQTEGDAQVLLDMADRAKAEGSLREHQAWKEVERLKAENATMRALLEEAAKEPPDFCWACPGKNYFGKIDHAYDCLITRMRAFLAEHKE